MKGGPTHKQLTSKIRRAIELIDDGEVYYIDEKIYGELEALEDLGVAEDEVFEVVRGFLIEIVAHGVTKCWRGKCPPEKSYEKKIQGCELWAFAAHSSRLKRAMYLKFALKKDRVFFYVSFHE